MPGVLAVDYKKYVLARDMAWKVLLDGGVHALPVSTSGLCRTMGIRVKLYEGGEDSDGESTILGGEPLILVSRNKPVPPSGGVIFVAFCRWLCYAGWQESTAFSAASIR